MMRALRSAPESAPKTRNSGMWRHLSPDRSRLLQTLQALPCLRPCIPPKKALPTGCLSPTARPPSPAFRPPGSTTRKYSLPAGASPRPAPGGLQGLSREFFPSGFPDTKKFSLPPRKEKETFPKKRPEDAASRNMEIKNIFINRLYRLFSSSARRWVPSASLRAQHGRASRVFAAWRNASRITHQEP